MAVPVFIPGLWADAIMEKIMGGKNVIPGAAPLGGRMYTTKAFPDLTPQLEAFFVAFALEHGTHPEPTFGIDRENLTNRIQHALAMFGATPDMMKLLTEQFRAQTNSVGDMPPAPGYLFQQLASCYLDWLYSQPESMALREEQLKKLANEKHESLYPYGYKVVDYTKDGWGYDG